MFYRKKKKKEKKQKNKTKQKQVDDNFVQMIHGNVFRQIYVAKVDTNKQQHLKICSVPIHRAIRQYEYQRLQFL